MRLELLGLCFTDAQGARFSHDPGLAALSFLIAAAASYAALGLAERYHLAERGRAPVWLGGAAVALGGGIWSMHFVAMLAFDAGVAVSYDPAMTTLSLLLAIAVAGLGLAITGRRDFSWYRLALSGALIGAGVVVMHYTGMAGMRLPGTVAYTPGLFGASILIAVAAATAAVWLAFNHSMARFRILVAIVMAAGICGMHYTGMAATVLQIEPIALGAGDTGHEALAVAVAGSTLGILLLGMFAAAADRRITAAAAREAEALREANLALQEATAKAEAANRAKSDFLAMVAHEFRTPLNGIIGFSDLLMEQAHLEPEQIQWCRYLRTAGNTLSDLVNDVVEFTRLEREEVEFAAEPFAVADLLAGCVAVARFQAIEKGLSLTEEMASDVPVRLVGDARRVRQIVGNLLTNAVKYTDRGGITVRVSRDGAHSLVVAVTDTGRGIAEPEHEAVFDRFRTGAGSGSRKQGGLGLGLAIARGIARRMGGDIGLESKLGCGSTFTARLPLPIAEEFSRPDRANLRVLVVDDVASNRQIIKACLKLQGHAVIEAASGEEAVELARGGDLDVVLMDIQMPGINGWEAARRIRGLSGCRGSVPIIAVTADATVGSDADDWGCHMVGYVAKPLDVRNFAAEVKRILAAAGSGAEAGRAAA